MGPGMQLVSDTQHIIGYKCNVTCEFLNYNCTTLIKNKRNLLMDVIVMERRVGWAGEGPNPSNLLNRL